MKAPGQFRYLKDPLFQCSCAAYALNRFVIKPHVAIPFFRNWFNDLLLIPCALPLLLFCYRKLGLRLEDTPPLWREILWVLVFWSILFEWIGPRMYTRATGDVRDVAAYAIGAVASGIIWRVRGGGLRIHGAPHEL